VYQQNTASNEQWIRGVLSQLNNLSNRYWI